MVAFEPQYMQVGILTAALQDLTPRKVRDRDPDQAIVDWAQYANELGVNRIQLATALHPSKADIPKEAMLDPVADHLDLRTAFSEERATRVRKALEQAEVTISDIGYFDNMLHGKPNLRQIKHGHMIQAMNAAQILGVKAVCGFVGRAEGRDMDQSLADFKEYFIPLLQAAKERDLVFRVEACPMPGWNTTDISANNIAYVPGTPPR